MIDGMDQIAASRPLLRRVGRADVAFLGLSAGIVVFDLLIKWIVKTEIHRGGAWPSHDWDVRIIHTVNTGAAFGILQDSGPLLVIVGVIGAALIFLYLFSPAGGSLLMRAGLSLMLGGALGNLIDRLGDGEVTDFIKFPEWPAFNVADSAITIGVFLLLWAVLQDSREEPEESTGS